VSEWIEVDQRKLAAPRREVVNGVEMQVFVSPYDVPQAIRGAYDDSKHRFAIELKYVGDDEPLESRQPHDNVVMFVGKESGRLKRIEIDVDRLNVSAVALKIISAIDSFAKQSHTFRRRTNYDAAKKAIEGQSRRLFEFSTS
jgi:hypothetical protein